MNFQKTHKSAKSIKSEKTTKTGFYENTQKLRFMEN
jgi:hypothetical protein